MQRSAHTPQELSWSFALLFVGGYVGGTIVFQYGMRVQSVAPETPMVESLKPKIPPD